MNECYKYANYGLDAYICYLTAPILKQFYDVGIDVPILQMEKLSPSQIK